MADTGSHHGTQGQAGCTIEPAVAERNEQQGDALLAEGVFGAFRNPVAWEVSEEVAPHLSMIRRRFDGARRCGGAC